MKYEITIKETKNVKKVVSGSYGKIGDEEVRRDESYFSGDSKEPKTRIKYVYGYPPEEERTVEVVRTVLSQEVDELDLKAVIKAINGI